LASGRSEQQIPEIVAEDCDGIGVGALFEFEADFRRDGRIEHPFPGIFDGQVQVRGPVAGLLVNFNPDEVECTLRFQFDDEVQDAGGFAAVPGSRSMHSFTAISRIPNRCNSVTFAHKSASDSAKQSSDSTITKSNLWLVASRSNLL
jgi:hypothetical protein